jgi:hypothetical protein
MRAYINIESSGVIDLVGEVTLSLNYSIADIREPDKRNASYSKTLKLAGSPNNNKILGHIFEIDIYSSFNPTIKTSAQLIVDGMPVMNGYLQLLNITRDKDKIEYDAAIVSSVGNVFTDIGERLLSDLDFSAYNHTYSAANQQASWSASVGSGYVYPFIDYGYNNGQKWLGVHLMPALYAKEYLDKIFAQAGYTYTSPFFNSDYFKRLIIPYSGGVLKYTDEQVAERLFSAYNTGTQAIGSSLTKIVFDSETTDPLNQFNTSSYLYRPFYNGVYKFNTTINVQSNGTGVAEYRRVYVYIILNNGSARRQILAAFNDNINIGAAQTVTITTNEIYLATGVNNFVEVYVQSVTGGITLAANSTFSNEVVNNGLRGGETVTINNSIPRNVKQKDFFKSIVNMHNLYVDIDPNNPKNIIIEPRNEFYSSGTVKDWTPKLDISRQLEIKPIANINTKRYKYSYKGDNDYYNELYRKHKGEVYGTRSINLDNDFITGETNNEVIFSPTPLVNNNNTGTLISSMASGLLDSTTNEIEERNIRILYYGGLKTTNNKMTYNGATISTFPYAGHLDDFTTPTRDICFGVPKEVFFKTTKYTTNNLYNMYHKRYLDEITDRDSKMVTGYFYLTPVDILQLDFRCTYIVQGHALRLNSISDYDPINNTPCKCEFIKINVKPNFIGQTVNNGGGINVVMAST